MTLFSLDDELNNWFDNLPEELKQDFQRNTGIVFSSLDLDGRLTALETYMGIKNNQFTREREDKVREGEHEFQTKLAQMQMQTLGMMLVNALTQSTQIMMQYGEQGIKRIEETLKSVGEKYSALQSTQKALPYSTQNPLSLSYTNCIRYHSPTKEFPAGRPGPARTVLTYTDNEGIHMRCLTAYSSQNPDDKGFARLPYQIFHAELLRQGDCPRPLSRSVTRRIPGLSWLFLKPDICPLADGKEHVIEYGK